MGRVIITVCWDCQGMISVDVMPRGEKINSKAKIRTLTELREFQSSSNSQKSNINPVSAWQCKTRHKPEDSQNYHKIWLNNVTPSSLQSSSSTLWFPPAWSLKECNPWYEFWDDDNVIHALKTWLREQTKAWFWQGRRVCGKTDYKANHHFLYVTFMTSEKIFTEKSMCATAFRESLVYDVKVGV